MTVENGFCYFGYFTGMAYTKYKDKQLEEDFDSYKQYKNTLPKEVIIKHIESLSPWLAPMQSLEIFTGEDLTAGMYKDKNFRFPTDFLHYLKTYDIGIPYEYEKYLVEELHLGKEA
jgi:hypothetical protein